MKYSSFAFPPFKMSSKESHRKEAEVDVVLYSCRCQEIFPSDALHLQVKN